MVVYPLAWLTRFAALSPVHNSIVEYTFAAMLNCLSCAHSHFDFKVNQSAYSCYLHAGHVGKVRLPDIARFSRWNPRLFGQCLLNWTKCCRKPSNCAKRNHGTKQDMGSCKMSRPFTNPLMRIVSLQPLDPPGQAMIDTSCWD